MMLLMGFFGQWSGNGLGYVEVSHYLPIHALIFPFFSVPLL